MNLYDMMRAAGGGDAFATLAPHFGLGREQFAKAVEAFLPAFSAGLKRTTADPLGMMELMRRLTATNYFRAYQDPAWLSIEGRREGEEALRFLFGSSEAAEALARQASAFSGIPAAKMGEILPMLASLVFGGLASQTAAIHPAMMGMLDHFKAPPEPQKDRGKGPLDRYEEEQERREEVARDAVRATADAMHVGAAAFQAGVAAWQDAVGSMMRTVGGGAISGAGETPEDRPAGETAFGELFEPGRRVNEAYQREIEALLSRFSPGATRSRGPS